MFRHVTWDEIRPPPLFALSLYYAIRFHRGPGGKLGLDPPPSPSSKFNHWSWTVGI